MLQEAGGGYTGRCSERFHSPNLIITWEGQGMFLEVGCQSDSILD